jgi:hypothetical protein
VKKRIKRQQRSSLLVAVALLVVIVGANIAFFATRTSAALVTARSIQMSSSAVSATSTVYKVKWIAGSSTSIKSIVIDFCSNSPIIGDTTCTAPTGFSLTASPTITLNTGLTATWTPGTLNTNRTLTLTKAAGETMSAGVTSIDFTINTVTNPSTTGTFYARIYTYANDAGANSAATYTVATPGTYVDYGGIAISTVNQLTITTKVQETLTFCIYTTGANCAGGTGTALALGDSNGVLSVTTTTYTGTAKFGVASNATSGVSVAMKGPLPTSGSNDIDTHGVSCTADSASNATEQFGMRVSVAGAGLTATSPYNCSAASHGFDTSSTTSTYGDVIATSTGPLDEVQSTMEFAAKSALTTPAGVYTTTLTFIATGTF